MMLAIASHQRELIRLLHHHHQSWRIIINVFVKWFSSLMLLETLMRIKWIVYVKCLVWCKINEAVSFSKYLASFVFCNMIPKIICIFYYVGQTNKQTEQIKSAFLFVKRAEKLFVSWTGSDVCRPTAARGHRGSRSPAVTLINAMLQLMSTDDTNASVCVSLGTKLQSASNKSR